MNWLVIGIVVVVLLLGVLYLIAKAERKTSSINEFCDDILDVIDDPNLYH